MSDSICLDLISVSPSCTRDSSFDWHATRAIERSVLLYQRMKRRTASWNRRSKEGGGRGICRMESRTFDFLKEHRLRIPLAFAYQPYLLYKFGSHKGLFVTNIPYHSDEYK